MAQPSDIAQQALDGLRKLAAEVTEGQLDSGYAADMLHELLDRLGIDIYTEA
jgi:hypothetical protein